MSLRIWRSPYTRFGELSKVPDDRLDATVTAVKVYDEAALRALIERAGRFGIRSQSRRMRVVAWNWSWTAYEKAPCTGIIAQLPKDVVVMADFERGGSRRVL